MRTTPAPAQRVSPKAWLQGVVSRIRARVHPSKIILFGSFAYGRPKPDSDIDLLVLLDGPKSRTKGYDMVDRAVGEHLWPIDIIVRSPSEVEERLRIGDSFFSEILHCGKVLYES